MGHVRWDYLRGWGRSVWETDMCKYIHLCILGSVVGWCYFCRRKRSQLWVLKFQFISVVHTVYGTVLYATTVIQKKKQNIYNKKTHTLVRTQHRLVHTHSGTLWSCGTKKKMKNKMRLNGRQDEQQ